MDTIQTILHFQKAIEKIEDDEKFYTYEYASLDVLKNSNDNVFVTVGLVLNGKEYSPKNYTIDASALIFSSMDSRIWYDKRNNTLSDASGFYVFNCSCGEPGCAGYWNGIRVKARKKTVEWRVTVEDGYEFLGQNFFSFDKTQYINETIGLQNKIRQVEKELGRKVFIDESWNHGLISLDDTIKFFKERVIREQKERLKYIKHRQRK